MKTLLSFLTLAVFFMAFNAGAYTVPVRRDLKPASQQMIEKRAIDNAVVADVDRLVDDNASSDSVTTDITTFLAQPDVCRALSITPGGTTADVAAGSVVVSGTNIFGQAITESFAFAANASTATVGLSAFCTVTSVLLHIQDGTAATWDVGVIDVLGLHRCMSSKGDVIMAVFDNAREGTEPTCVADADEVEKNTCDIDGTLDGAKDIKLYFIQNFVCLP